MYTHRWRTLTLLPRQGLVFGCDPRLRPDDSVILRSQCCFDLDLDQVVIRALTPAWNVYSRLSAQLAYRNGDNVTAIAHKWKQTS